MISIKQLIWDEWNREHINAHSLTIKEVEEVCHNPNTKAVQTYRGRIQLFGETKNKKQIAIILSPEDRDLNKYQQGTYYPITAFEERTSK